MQSPIELFDEQMRTQAAMLPAPEDESQWLTRCLFVPFRDRPFSTEYIQEYCGLMGLTAGRLIPIPRGRQTIPDYDQIGKVPKGLENRGPFGLSAMKTVEKAPAMMVESLLHVFNPHHGTDPQQDNGICEVVELRGETDMALVRDISKFCLPKRYLTAREQLAQLEQAANNTNAPSVFLNVAARLLAATETAKTWAGWHRDLLEAAMEDRVNTGKDRVSPLDRAVCAWLELPEPRFRSQLGGQAPIVVQTPSVPTAPQIWCGECGAYSNLGPNGEKPKRCAACQTSFEVTETIPDMETAEIQPSTRESKQERTERLQRESRERNGKK